MEQLFSICGVKVLLTTAANRQECQAWSWWDSADVIISVQTHVASNAVKVLKGEDILQRGAKHIV